MEKIKVARYKITLRQFCTKSQFCTSDILHGGLFWHQTKNNKSKKILKLLLIVKKQKEKASRVRVRGNSDSKIKLRK